ncbi:transcription termination/antitermination NusG family protein [Novosphingobium sp.]|uniref:transcription termination/antitermination protein NusG n=1 Tax=Novosphingobium sp. TaxID=1874826 RepID=UPI0033428F10
MGWFVVETLPGREAIAVQNLKLQNFVTFWPQFEKVRQAGRQAKMVMASLFPNYIFVQLDMGAGRLRSINGTFGVKRLLSNFGGRPSPIAQPIMAHLFARCERGGMTHQLASYEQGQLARVVAGPLADKIVLIERLDPIGRVCVLMELLGTTVTVSLPTKLLVPH